MTRHFDQRAIERAAVILRVTQSYFGGELDDALKAARRAIGSMLASFPANMVNHDSPPLEKNPSNRSCLFGTRPSSEAGSGRRRRSAAIVPV
jgi:hypothetical protein